MTLLSIIEEFSRQKEKKERKTCCAEKKGVFLQRFLELFSPLGRINMPKATRKSFYSLNSITSHDESV